jgi:hypothetical protein
MKINVNTVKTFDLHELTAREIRDIIDSLNYKAERDKNYGLKLLADQIESSCGVYANEKISVHNATNVELDSFEGPADFFGNGTKFAELENKLNNMEISNSLQTKDILINIGCKENYRNVVLIYGKQYQLIISTENKITNEKVSLALNKSCVDMLYDFLKHEGKSALEYLPNKVGFKNRIYSIEAYKDTDGNESYDKYFRMTYNSVKRTLGLKKEDDHVIFTAYETLCIKKFLEANL